MDISTDDLSAFLNYAWERAKPAANTLPVQLLAEQLTAIQLVASGSVASIGKNSTSQAYGFYGPGNLTHRQIVNVYTTLIRYYSACKQAIQKAAETASVGLTDFDFDQPVFDLMTKAFQVGSQSPIIPDISQLRYPGPIPQWEVCA